jgi:glycine zipper 2TM protein
MNRLFLALVAMVAFSACSDTRDRRIPAADNSAQRPDLTLPDTMGLASVRGVQPVSPVEQQVTRPPEKAPVAAHPSTQRRKRPTRSAAPPADTVIHAYAPGAAADSASPSNSTKTVASVAQPVDTGARVPESVPSKPDTIAAAAMDSTSAATPDTTLATDTASSTSVSAARSTAATRTLPVGTEIRAALDDSIDSRHDSTGQTIAAHVMENVTGPDGRTLIAAGTPVRLTVTRISPARSKGSQGALTLRADGIALNGQLQPVKADVRPVPRELRGRGVTGSEAAKVGVGAAGGAVLGRVIGGNTKGAVIGGVVGAAGGAVVASQTATHDVVVKAKTPVVLVLTEPLTAP